MKRRSEVAFALISLVLMLISAHVSDAEAQAKKALIVKGAISGSSLVQKLGDTFQKKPPHEQVIVIGTTSEKGFKALLEKEADLALIVGKLTKEQEQRAAKEGIEPTGKLIGNAGPAIITHPRNSVNNLTMEQMKRIFRGEYKNWEEVGGADEPIRVLAMRPQRSDFAKMFELWALEWMHFGKDTDFQDSFQDVIRNVSRAKDEPIGFVPYSQLIRSRYRYSVKVLALKRCDNCPAIEPSPQAFNSLKYPIGIPLYLYWNGKTASDMVRNFVGFCAARAKK